MLFIISMFSFFYWNKKSVVCIYVELHYSKIRLHIFRNIFQERARTFRLITILINASHPRTSCKPSDSITSMSAIYKRSEKQYKQQTCDYIIMMMRDKEVEELRRRTWNFLCGFNFLFLSLSRSVLMKGSLASSTLLWLGCSWEMREIRDW